MVRRQITLLALLFTTFALAACVSPTAPKNADDCGVSAGSGTCPGT